MKLVIITILMAILAGLYFIFLNKKTDGSTLGQHSSKVVSTSELTLDGLFEGYKKPAIRLYRLAGKDQNKDFLSYLGGRPSLPENLAWPKDQHFVAQINLADVPQNDLLPRQGILYFFADLYEKGYYYKNRHSATTVLYAKNFPLSLTQAKLPSELQDRMQSGPDRDGNQKVFPKWPFGFAAIDSHSIEKLPKPIVDKAFEAGIWDAYFEGVEGKTIAHSQSLKGKMAADTKPHWQHQLLGYSPPRTNPIQTDADDILLLHLFSDYGVSFLFGDMDSLQFYINKDDLKQGRFDKAWGVAG